MSRVTGHPEASSRGARLASWLRVAFAAGLLPLLAACAAQGPRDGATPGLFLSPGAGPLLVPSASGAAPPPLPAPTPGDRAPATPAAGGPACEASPSGGAAESPASSPPASRLSAAPSRAQPDGGGLGDASAPPAAAEAGAPADAAEREEGPRSRRSRRPLALWPFVDLRSYDRFRDGPDARLSEYARSDDVEILWPLFAHYDWKKLSGTRGGHTHVFPLYWGSDKDEIGYSVLFPFWWSHWATKTSWTHVLPVWGEYEKGTYHKTFFPDPLVSWGSDSATGDWDFEILWPLCRFGKKGKELEGRVAPFFFYGSSPELEYTVVPPFFVYARKPGFWGTRVAFPFWWEHWDGPESGPRTQAIPPFWGRFEWLERGKEESLETLFPLYWKYRGAESSADVVLPFYWDFRDRGKQSRVVFPFWYQFDTDDVQAKVFFPFYWDVGKPTGPGQTVVVPPLYLLDAPEKDRGVEAITPFYWNWWDGDASGWALLPFYGRHRGKDASLDTVLPPLFWFTEYGDTSGFVAAPFWWQFENEKAGSFFRAAPPLYWDFQVQRDGVRGTTVFPFYTRIADAAEKRGVLVVPPYMSAWWDGSHARLLPPVWADVVDAKSDAQWSSVLPPLYWWYRAPGYSSEVLPPWWRFQDDKDGTFARGVFPLYWDWGNRRGERNTVLAPLYFDFDGGPRKERFTLWPLQWRYENREAGSRLGGVFPLHYDFSWKGGQEQFSTLFPFTWHFRNPQWGFDYVFPFWGRYAEASGFRREFLLFPLASWESDPARKSFGVDVLWPLFGYEDSPEGTSWRALPFWIHDTRKSDGRDLDFVLPFACFMDAKDYRYGHVFPFWFEYVNRRGGEGRRSGWSSLLGPAWVHTFDEEEGLSRDDVLWPLFTSARRRDETAVSVRPLFYYTEDKDRAGAVLLPFLFHHDTPEKSETAVPPLFWQSVSKERTQRLFLPLYYEDAGEKDGARVLAPFYWNFWDRSSSTLHLWPFFGSERKWDSENREWKRLSTLYPFFSVETDDRNGRKVGVDAPWPLVRYEHEIGRLTGTCQYSFQALPIVGAWGKTGERGSGHFLSAIPPAYAEWTKDEDLAILPFLYHRRDRTEDRTENVLFPFVWSFETPQTSTFHVWPLAGWREARGGDGELAKWEFSLGWPFGFSVFRNVPKDLTEVDLLWPFIHYDEEPGHTRFRAFPLAWYERHEGDEQWSSLFPLWIQWQDLEKEDHWRLDLMWPLFALHRNGPAWHNRLLPLWWYEGDEEYDTLVAPFSLYSRRRDDWDLAVLFPLFHCGNYPSAKSWQVDLLWPVFSVLGRESGTHSHLLPLYWHDSDARDESSFTVAPPVLSWHYSRRSLSSTGILFPLFKHRRESLLDETQVDLLWPLISYRKERDFTHSRFLPLWWHDGGEKESLTIVPPLLAFHRRDGDSGFGSFLFPLTWYSWKEGRSSEFRVLWELASYCEEGDAWDFRILYKLVHLGKRGPAFEFEMLPFFRFETYEGRLTHFSILGGLFAYDWDIRRRESEWTLFYFLQF